MSKVRRTELIEIKHFKRSALHFDGEGVYNAFLIFLGVFCMVFAFTPYQPNQLLSPTGFFLFSLLCLYPAFKKRAVQMVVWGLADHYEKVVNSYGIEYDSANENCFSQTGKEQENRLRHDPDLAACWDGERPLFNLDDRRCIWLGEQKLEHVDTDDHRLPYVPLTNIFWSKINIFDAVRLALIPGGEKYGREVVKKRNIRFNRVYLHQ